MSAPTEAELPPFMAEMTAIALGGALGACLRFAVSLAIVAAHLPGALASGIVNIVGSFLLGLAVGHLESGRAHPLLHPFLTVGVFGSFTTFSALALDNRALAGAGGEGLAIVHLAGTIVLGLAAFAFGNAVDAVLERAPGRTGR
jgi:CrcB protein